ncbi:MAG: hypothetical protein LUD57_02750 [Ruminococcus sp.]|nr:hypothetical protein [Ruminococcus sp.]
MYLKENVIKLLHVKNVIFIIVSVFSILVCGTYIISEFTYYRDDIEYALEAVSMKSSIIWIIISTVLLVFSAVSRTMIKKAAFYSSFFEGDLDRFVKYSDLAAVTGKKPSTVKLQLTFFRFIYMKNYRLTKKDNAEIVELYSKKITCECRSCGAHMEKRAFFTNACPYCGSSDLFAKVLANDRFYSISSDFRSGIKNPDYYKGKSLNLKLLIYSVLNCIGLFLAICMFFVDVTYISNYFDHDYQREVLLSNENHLYSYDLIKTDILDSIIYVSIFFIVFFVLSYLGIKRQRSIINAKSYAEFFSKCGSPFVEVKSLPAILPSREKKKLKKFGKAVEYRYLVHCTLEMHNNAIVAALAKKIVKDQCPRPAEVRSAELSMRAMCADTAAEELWT